MTWTADRHREIRAVRLAAGRCAECERRRVPGERELCTWCAARAAKSRRRYRTSPKGRATERARLSRRRAELAAARLCRRACGAPAVPGRSSCARHLEADKVAAAMRPEASR